MEEGDIACFFAKDLGFALASNMCVTNRRLLKRSITVRRFREVDEPLSCAPRHVCTRIENIDVGTTDCVGPILRDI